MGVAERCASSFRATRDARDRAAVRNVFLNIDRARVRGLDYELLVQPRASTCASNQVRSADASVLGRPAARGQHDVADGHGRLRDDGQREPLRRARPRSRSLRCATRSARSASNWQQRYIPETVLNVADRARQWQPGHRAADGRHDHGRRQHRRRPRRTRTSRSPTTRDVERRRAWASVARASATCSTTIRRSLPTSASASARRAPGRVRRERLRRLRASATC